VLTDLLHNNRNWSEIRRREDPEFFSRLAALQRPEYLWIGCSDSRVPANVITGLKPGEVFVHRNVANLVHRSDLNLLSVVEFAVELLEVQHIIVCGHYGCGGIRAAMEPHRHGIVDHWLQPVRDIAEDSAAQITKVRSVDDRNDRLSELSVRAQVNNLARTPILRSAWSRGSMVEVHGWIYGLSDGLLRDLKCDFGPAQAGTLEQREPHDH
jgi:carbonic anhydrase